MELLVPKWRPCSFKLNCTLYSPRARILLTDTRKYLCSCWKSSGKNRRIWKWLWKRIFLQVIFLPLTKLGAQVELQLLSDSCAALDESLGIVEVKAILSHFSDNIPEIDRSVLKYVCSYALGRIQSRIVSFEEQVCRRLETYAQSKMTHNRSDLTGDDYQDSSGKDSGRRAPMASQCGSAVRYSAGERAQVSDSIHLVSLSEPFSANVSGTSCCLFPFRFLSQSLASFFILSLSLLVFFFSALPQTGTTVLSSRCRSIYR